MTQTTDQLSHMSAFTDQHKSSTNNDEPKYWFVMRDLKRSNSKLPAYKQLADEHYEVFTPLKQILTTHNGKRKRKEVPFIQDLLFIHGTESEITHITNKIPTLQLRFQKGHYRKPMIVRNTDMKRFIHAVNVAQAPKYYLPEEITPAMYKHTVQIIGGNLDGYKGILLTTRGSKTKRLLVDLPQFFSVAVEIHPEYIKFL